MRGDKTKCDFFGMPFMWMPAGEFMMGAYDDEDAIVPNPYEFPQHRVTFRHGFWMGECTVTQKQWWDVMGSYPSEWQEVEVIDSIPSEWKRDDLPVMMVNWNEAQNFLKRLNQQSRQSFRLPSEAEWEYACRAGTTGPFSFDLPITTDKANYNGGFSYAGSPEGEFRGRPLPVRSFQPNPWGLYQMHGNVWEWTQDAWHQNYEGAPIDGTVWESNAPRMHAIRVVGKPIKIVPRRDIRVMRGGDASGSPDCLRSAFRTWFPAESSPTYGGFRLVHG